MVGLFAEVPVFRFPILKNRRFGVPVAPVPNQKGISGGRNIVESEAVGFQIVNLVPLLKVQQIHSLAIGGDSPSAFRISETQFNRGRFGVGVGCLHTHTLFIIDVKSSGC